MRFLSFIALALGTLGEGLRGPIGEADKALSDEFDRLRSDLGNLRHDHGTFLTELEARAGAGITEANARIDALRGEVEALRALVTPPEPGSVGDASPPAPGDAPYAGPPGGEGQGPYTPPDDGTEYPPDATPNAPTVEDLTAGASLYAPTPGGWRWAAVPDGAEVQPGEVALARSATVQPLPPLPPGHVYILIPA